MIKILRNLALLGVKNAIFSPNNSAKIFLKPQHRSLVYKKRQKNGCGFFCICQKKKISNFPFFPPFRPVFCKKKDFRLSGFLQKNEYVF
jgi:hypothetical protein